MKRIIALILAAILLCASCVAVAETSSFEITIDFEKGMCFKGVTGINGFLSALPLSKLECTAHEEYLAWVVRNDEETIPVDMHVGLDSITLYGERDEDAELYYFQLDVTSCYFDAESQPWETYKDQWLDEHPRANIAWHYYKGFTSGEHRWTNVIILYYQSKL